MTLINSIKQLTSKLLLDISKSIKLVFYMSILAKLANDSLPIWLKLKSNYLNDSLFSSDEINISTQSPVRSLPLITTDLILAASVNTRASVRIEFSVMLFYEMSICTSDDIHPSSPKQSAFRSASVILWLKFCISLPLQSNFMIFGSFNIAALLLDSCWLRHEFLIPRRIIAFTLIL